MNHEIRHDIAFYRNSKRIFQNFFHIKRHMVSIVSLKHQNALLLVIVGGIYPCDNEAIKQKQTHPQREDGTMKKTFKSKKGFSLVETIVVIAIICILAGVLLFNYIGVFRNCMEALGGI